MASKFAVAKPGLKAEGFVRARPLGGHQRYGCIMNMDVAQRRKKARSKKTEVSKDRGNTSKE